MSDELKNYLVESLKNQLSDYRSQAQVENVGFVVELGDGVAKVNGLSQAMSLEMVAFPNDIFGVVLNLEEDLAGVIILGDYRQLKEGDMVKTTGRVLEVPVGEELIGRVINPLGAPLDEKGSLKLKNFYPVEKIAPRVIEREPVKISLQTGIKAIDAIIPIGRGQRELIIGDRQTGKTALAIDAIINQKDQNVICIYVAIGQKDSSVAKTVAKLAELGALDHTIVVAATASHPAALNYIAPFAGCAMAEYFKDQGKDVLIVYDDLSKHAVAYRQLSLLLRRPPSREAYPGDIFYLHSRLLERACKISQEKGGGSITALPIIETQAGDISAYIPTNVISITDGQIYLEGDLFYQGIRPALNVGLSVSRVGSTAQIKAMKKVAGKMRLDLAQFRELAAFVQFASDLDKATQAQIERGMRLTEVLKQEQYCPMPVECQVSVLYAAVNGFLDDIVIDKIKDFEKGLLQYLDNQGKKTLQSIKETKDITEQTEQELKKLIDEYKSIFVS